MKMYKINQKTTSTYNFTINFKIIEIKINTQIFYKIMSGGTTFTLQSWLYPRDKNN